MEIWKLVLAWGCLVIFFSFPFVMLAVHIPKIPEPNFALEFRYLGEYLKTVTAIIISLAGFDTVGLFRGRGNKDV